MIPPELLALGAKVRPMRDKVAWVRDEYKNPFGLILPGESTKLHRGYVIAIGTGRRLRRKLPVPVAQGQVHMAEVGAETGRVRPMTVQVGDFLEFSQYGQIEFELDGYTVILSGEDSVLGYSDPDAQGVMFPAPAGFDDRNRTVVGKF